MGALLSCRGRGTPWLVAVVCGLLLVQVTTTFADSDMPVTASLSVNPASAAEGGVIELKLKLTVTGAWHVYGDSPGSGGEQPLNLKLKHPEGVEPVGKWVWPASSSLFLAGEHVFTHKLKLAGLKGKGTVDVTLMYQACDPQMCLPPEVILLEAEVSAGSAADADLKALEEEVLPEVKDSARQAYDALSYPEQLRYIDRHWRSIFDRCEAFVNKYPDDPRTLDVVRMCITRYLPFFHEQNDAVQRSSVEAAVTGWNYVLANGIGEGGLPREQRHSRHQQRPG